MGPGKAIPPPVVDEAKGDWVPGVAGGRGPALRQHHLKTALLPVKPHLDLDLITGGHGIILRYGRLPNEQLHFGDKIPSPVEVFNDSVDPVGEEALRSLLCAILSSQSSPQKVIQSGIEAKEAPPLRPRERRGHTSWLRRG